MMKLHKILGECRRDTWKDGNWRLTNEYRIVTRGNEEGTRVSACIDYFGCKNLDSERNKRKCKLLMCAYPAAGLDSLQSTILFILTSKIVPTMEWKGFHTSLKFHLS